MAILGKILKLFLGDKKQKDLKLLYPLLEQIKVFEKDFSALNHDALRQKTKALRDRIKKATQATKDQIATLEQEALQADVSQRENVFDQIDALKEQEFKISEKMLMELLPEAFAIIKETAKRFAENQTLSVTATVLDRELSATKDYIDLQEDKAIWQTSWDASGNAVSWNMIHYDVQLIGGVVLHQGKIAEMMTGEGKTLVATLPIYLNALTGRGVHVVTVNDYLAKRDAAWMAPIWEFHGLTVDCIDMHLPNSPQRKQAYQADITYGTNNEFGFDYLRDNMATDPSDLVQRAHNYAIIDEVDSVLIDDARTPLIISGPVPDGDRHEFNELRPKVLDIIKEQRQYLVEVLAEAKKLIQQGDTKQGGFLLLRVYRGLPKNKALIKFLSGEGVKQLLQKTQNYYMADNNKEMPKVDETLYFVIDEKNNQIDLTEKGITFLSKGVGESDFFVLPDMHMATYKIDNSEKSAEQRMILKQELYRDFNLKSERIHTVSQLLKAYTLFEKNKEYVLVDNKVKIVDEQTGRIMEGRRYSDGLHQAIEAKENVKIEEATQTFATITLQNYFRMYHKLSGMTGTAITEAGEFWEIYKLDVVEIPTNKPLARDDKEDLVYKTVREKYNAIIAEVTALVKRGRPVLVGTTSVEISELLSRMLSIRKIKHNVLNAKLHKKEADIVADAGKSGMVTIATNMAGRGTDIKLTDAVKKAGGLAIVGTERHDSRRVDRQLRGRSGRQGDVGSSQFYVSLEDHLMRIFGSERIAKMMDRMGLKEGEVIQHSMITKSIERAQKKVEQNNFGIRKRLLEYDDVMNAQREVIYKRRRHALYGKRLQVDIANMIHETCNVIVESSKSTEDFESFENQLIYFFTMQNPYDKTFFKQKSPQELTQDLYGKVVHYYKERVQKNIEKVYPFIERVYQNEADKYERIVIPFTDGVKTLQVITNLKLAYQTQGQELVKDFEKNVTLSIIDEAWKNHLHKMDDLKQSVQNASYEQKDPLLIYKFEAFELFKGMLQDIGKDVISFLFRGALPSEEQEVRVGQLHRKKEQLKLQKDNFDEPEPTPVETFVRDKPKIGRNERITIQNIATGETQDIKYKKALPLLEEGTWVHLSGK